MYQGKSGGTVSDGGGNTKGSIRAGGKEEETQTGEFPAAYGKEGMAYTEEDSGVVMWSAAVYFLHTFLYNRTVSSKR